jgi:two-component system, OmpR family, sensor histidine kinase MtrB
MSFRGLFTLAMSLLLAVSLVGAAALIAVSSWLHQAAEGLGDAVESVRAAQEMEIALLLHSRAQDPMLRAQLHSELRALQSSLEAHQSGPAEAARLRAVSAAVEAYLADEAAPDRGPALARAYQQLEALVEFNRQAANETRRRALGWDRTANALGFSVAITLVALVGGLSVSLRRWAVRALDALERSVSRYGHGDLTSRAPEHAGPREFRSVARTFNRTAEALAADRQARVEMVAGVAHDLRNPLTALKLAAASARGREQLTIERAQRLLAMVEQQAAQMDRLLTDLVDLARADAGELSVDLAPCDLATLAQEVVALYRAREPDRVVQLSLESDELWLSCDRARIAQVLGNLLSNALKYSSAERPVQVRAARGSAEAWLEVADQGMGIPPEERERIFEPFARAEGARRVASGVGIGLAIARRLVEAHGGRLELDSQMGVGTRFTVRLPLSPEHRVTSSSPAEARH